jgi:hypothetical protein
VTALYDLDLKLGSPTAFGEGPAGEVYILTRDNGIWEITER